MSPDKFRELSHQADLAAYEVCGAARVLFRLVADPELRRNGLEALAKLDQRRKALSDLEKENANAI